MQTRARVQLDDLPFQPMGPWAITYRTPRVPSLETAPKWLEELAQGAERLGFLEVKLPGTKPGLETLDEKRGPLGCHCVEVCFLGGLAGNPVAQPG